jgi:hypothetical protein
MLNSMRPVQLFWLFTLLPAFAADPNLTGQYRAVADRLINAALSDTEGYAKLEYLCYRIGNRLSGSEALQRAVSWSEQQMKRDGLSNVRTIPVKVPHWVRGSESARLVAPENKALHILGIGMSVGTPAGGITADVVAVSDFTELTQLGRERVQGKIVVYNEPFHGYGTTVIYRTSGASRAAALGAAAVLVRSITPLAMQQPHTGTLRYDDNQPRIPAAAVSIEDAMMMARLYSEGVSVKVHLEMSAHLEPDADSADVMGEIPGRERPEEIVVLGGHSDSWDVGQGAQDDGSGIIASLQAVALIRKLGLQPRRTIRVVFWVNEENGGRGGQAYREWIGNSIANHVAAIEMDGGAEAPRGFGFGPFGGGGRRGEAASPPAPSGADLASFATLKQIANLLERVGAVEVTPGGGGSDISPITREGVPALAVRTAGLHYFDWHHTETDTLDKVDLDDFRKNIAALAVMSYVLADMPGRISGTRESSEP